MAIEFANWCKQHELATKQKNKFSVYVNSALDMDNKQEVIIWDFVVESLKVVFGENTRLYYDILGNLIEGGLFFFETDEQAWEFYGIFEQELTDSSNVYACIYSPADGVLTENT